MWLPERADAERAAREAALAVSIWEQEPPETRSLDDEALAHVYEATARVQFGDLDGAAVAVAPILDLPSERQISWIPSGSMADKLDDHVYARSHDAGDLRDQLRAAAN